MVQKHFQEKALAAQRAEKAQEHQLKRIAAFVAKEIRLFWSNVEKVRPFPPTLFSEMVYSSNSSTRDSALSEMK